MFLVPANRLTIQTARFITAAIFIYEILCLSILHVDYLTGFKTHCESLFKFLCNRVRIVRFIPIDTSGLDLLISLAL